MNQTSVEMENYKNKVASFVGLMETQPKTGENVAKVNNNFYIANIDGKRVVMQYGVSERTKEFLSTKIAEMGLTREIKTQEEESSPVIMMPEYAEL